MQRSSAPTLNDVAREAGVNTATISVIINVVACPLADSGYGMSPMRLNSWSGNGTIQSASINALFFLSRPF
ncbi:MAG: LacI family DNA-binding transcriptional regulator [Cytophagales bacterium]|nr:LacI family DNA-binding transcriptional regulator [Armatimonadota bacterium]